MHLSRIALNIVAAAVLASTQAADRTAMLTGLQRQDAQVASVGFSLARANRPLCGDAAMLTGITPHYLGQYDPGFRDAAAHLFGLSSLPSVLAVAKDSPAERAGIRVNDRLVSADGAPFAPASVDTAMARFDDTERALDLIDRAAADDEVILRVDRAGVLSTATLNAEKGCRSRFQVVPGDGYKAQADGAYVQISAGLVEFAKSEGELASILSHELAHNILRHKIRLEAQGALTKGLFGPGSRNAKLILATEIEADRLSAYLMARAGYDPRDAVRYWLRHGAERGDRWFRAGTHPRWRDRVRIIETEVDLIEAARKGGNAARLPPDLAALVTAYSG